MKLHPDFAVASLTSPGTSKLFVLDKLVSCGSTMKILNKIKKLLLGGRKAKKPVVDGEWFNRGFYRKLGFPDIYHRISSFLWPRIELLSVKFVRFLNLWKDRLSIVLRASV